MVSNASEMNAEPEVRVSNTHEEEKVEAEVMVSNTREEEKVKAEMDTLEQVIAV